MVASKLNRLDIILLLLNHPDFFDPEAVAQGTSENGYNFLHLLANIDITEESDILLLVRIFERIEELEQKTSCGTILNTGDNHGNTPLHMAIKKDNRFLIEILVGNNSVNIDVENSDCETPVIMCLLKNENALCKPFVRRMNKLICPTKAGLRKYVLRLFLSVIDDIVPRQKNKLFLSFIKYGVSTPLESFLNQSTYIHKALDENGFGCLHIAAREKRFDMIDLLLDTKRDNLIDMENAPNGNSPLHLFVRNTIEPGEEKAFNSSFDDIVKYMKNQGISDNPIDIPNKDGETPLHAACLKDNVYVIKFLIEKGANILAQSNKGEYPFHYAVRFCSSETIQHTISNIPNDQMIPILECISVEGTLLELARKYNPQLVPYLLMRFHENKIN